VVTQYLSTFGNWGSSSTWRRFNEAWFEAGDEPYMDTVDTIRCYNGYKEYRTRSVEIKCNKKTSSLSSGAYLLTTTSVTLFAAVAACICFL